ncbi:MAG: carbohydrate kinase family protein [Marinirhabdus sp.]
MSIACFGEILWDIFPDKKRLGGAPLNVALRLNSLGAGAVMLSAVGNDPLGGEALTEIRRHGLETATIVTVKNLPTGTVTVTLKDGDPSYTIGENVAWDSIALNPAAQNKMGTCNALIFGSLALRGAHNKHTLNKILQTVTHRILDLNLRKPFYSGALILQLLNTANLVKMNGEELGYVCSLLGISTLGTKQRLKQVSIKTATPTICVTFGSKGAALYAEGNYYRRPSFPIEVEDTVGAGDAFLAGLVFELLPSGDPEKALALGCALGALVASKKGANCTIAPTEVSKLLKQ